MFAVDWYGERYTGYGWWNLCRFERSTSAILLATAVEDQFDRLARVRDTATGKVVWHGRIGMAYMDKETLRAPVIRED